MARKITEEGRVAKKLSIIANDLSLDLEHVGLLLSDITPNVSFRRLQLIMEVAEQERSGYTDISHDY